MEIVLSSWCSGNDICSPISPEDELIRAHFGGRAMNFSNDVEFERSYRDAVSGQDVNRLRTIVEKNGRGRIMFKNHMPASRIKEELVDLWADSFTFSIDRHPYEKVVSAAYWEFGRTPESMRRPVSRRIDRLAKSGKTANFPLYMDGGKLLVDEVFRYDEMWEKMEGLAHKLGKAVPEILPRAKSRFRKDKRSAFEILTPLQKKGIQESCAPEFELLGWEK